MLAAIRSEFIKARSVRVTWWTLPLTVVIAAGLSYLATVGMRSAGQVAQLDASELRALTLVGIPVGLIALTVFAVMQIGGEYSTGSIRVWLSAVSSRGRYFAAKAVVTGCFALATGLLATVACLATVQFALGADGFALETLADVNAAQLPQAILGAGAFLTCMCLIALGLTASLRSSVAVMAILLPLLFLESQGIANLPAIKDYAQYLPMEAGFNVMRVIPTDDPRFAQDYGYATAWLILLAWTGAALMAGYLTTKYREA